MFYIKTDSGEHFSMYSGFSVLGPRSEFASAFEAQTAFRMSHYRAQCPDPKYFVVSKDTTDEVEIMEFEVKR